MSTTTVTTTETTVLIELNNAGVQGIPGVNAVVAVTSPITNAGSGSSAVIGINQGLLSLTKSQISDFTSGTVTSASTAQQSGTAVYSTTSGTAVYATTSGTATYATLSGTAVGLSGSITRSQVSDYSGGTVANISGTVTQAQVTNLVSDLSGKAALGSANTFTVGGQIVASQSDTVMPLTLRRASPTATASILEFQTSTGTAIGSVDASARGNFPFVSAGQGTDLGYGTLSVLQSGTATIGAVIRQITSGTADLQQWQDSTGLTVLARITSGGNATVQQLTLAAGNIIGSGGQTSMGIGTTRNVFLNAAAGSFGSGQAVTFIGNANAVPSTSPTGGGILYVNTGALSYRGTANAGQQIIGADGSIKFIAPTSTTVGAIVQGAASQSANLQSWQNSGATALASVDASGFGNFTRTSVGQASDLNYGTLSVLQTGIATVGAVIRQITSGTADLQQWQNSFGTNLGRMNTQGQFVAGGTTVTGNAMINSAPYGASQGGYAVKMAVDATANAFQIQNSAGVVIGGRNAAGQAFTGSFQPILSATGGTIQSIATGANPLVTTASAHSLIVGDLVTLTGTTGGVYDNTFPVATVPTTTTYTITTSLTTGQASPGGFTNLSAQKSITARTLNTRGLVVKGAPSQSANLGEFRNSADTILTRIDNLGVVRATGYNTNNFYVLTGEEQSGGYMVLTKGTAQMASPSTDRGRIYLRDGTVPTTLKLVIKAGVSGAETTILDNIPT